MRRHGIAATYIHAGCRCAPCTRANTDSVKRRITQRAARLAADPALAQHGSVSTYNNWGCRCRPCTDAWSAKCAKYGKARAAAIARGGQP